MIILKCLMKNLKLNLLKYFLILTLTMKPKILKKAKMKVVKKQKMLNQQKQQKKHLRNSL